MKSPVLPALLAVAALACGNAYDPGTGGGGGGGSPPPPNTVQLLTSGGDRFNPLSLTVPVGTTVHFDWVGGTHTVTSDGTPSFASSGPPTSAPHGYDVTFNAPGSYKYYCQVHGGPGVGMHGTIVVQ